MKRRQVLTALAGGALIPWRLLASPSAEAAGAATQLARDAATGLELIELPPGFRYRSICWTGDRLDDGLKNPARPDAMGIVRQRGSRYSLVRNHEILSQSGAFSQQAPTWDPAAGGGCTTLELDVETGQRLSGHASLAGTLINCAGGTTPWGSWLSCEECVLDPGDRHAARRGALTGLSRAHGYVFEVSPDGDRAASPLLAMGRFVHEAAVVEPASGHVFLTEDSGTAGFYRFLPDRPGFLAEGGRLQMARVQGHSDLRKHSSLHLPMAVDWVDIDDPERGHMDAKAGDGRGVFEQGRGKGGTRFTRLEGCWPTASGGVAFVSTNGGSAGMGQVWHYDSVASELRLIFESPGATVLNRPDNIVRNPHGGYLLCEDGRGAGQRLQWLRADGKVQTLGVNRVELNDGPNSISGDYQTSEWAGACFSPDGRYLFVNIQVPGITLAITGPWASLAG